MSAQDPAARPPDGERMQASVIVCTYNRADSLPRTLNCLVKQDLHFLGLMRGLMQGRGRSAAKSPVTPKGAGQR